MHDDNTDLTVTLGPCGVDIILLHDLQQSRACEACNTACTIPTEGDGGENVPGPAIHAGDGQPAKPIRQKVLQHHCHHENWYRYTKQRHAHEEPVEYPAFFHSGDYTAGYTSHPRDECCSKREVNGVGKCHTDKLRHTAVEGVARAEVTAHSIGYVTPKLYVYRLIQPELACHALDRL